MFERFKVLFIVIYDVFDLQYVRRGLYLYRYTTMKLYAQLSSAQVTVTIPP